MLVINPTLLSPPSSTLFPYTTLFRSYHHTTIGSMDDLNKATVEEVRSFFRTYYRPDNATLAIVGDFAAADAISWVEKYFGGIPRAEQPGPREVTAVGLHRQTSVGSRRAP